MLKEGTVLDGKYEILKQIGEGGMSVVYLARNNRMNMQLAVKEIKNDGSKSTEILLKGLEREANILKNVDHPVIPRIIDIVKYGGTICVVMDFIEGENLADKLKEVGAFPQEQVIEWGLSLASALDYLHSMNPPIIYRDMKPSNVMLKPDGDVKLIDFGTAKTYDIENNADTTALGTRGYAAPEQFGDAQGRGIYKTDARTDIYNLGATLYHMVTGKNPQEPPYEMVPIRQVDLSLSTGLEEIILKCTKPNPNERYQSCSELIYALEHYTELDVSYKNANKKKVAIFATSVALTLIFAGMAVGGKAGMNKEARNNYTAFIQNGDDLKVEENYIGAREEFKKAFEQNPQEADGYVKYIDLYIDSQSKPDSGLNLEDGLTDVANKIKAGTGDVNKNDEVLYKMGLTYFVELENYGAAAKYFAMVNKDSADYGEQAQYYGDMARILSSTNPNIKELIYIVDNFSGYNSNYYKNSDVQKYINYKTIGNLYTANLKEDGVPEKAEDAMEEALECLDEYTGEEEGKSQSDFSYEFNKNLGEIYKQIGNSKVGEDGDVTKASDDYDKAIISYQEVIKLVKGKVKSVDINVEDNKILKSYIQNYVLAIRSIADIYGKMNENDKAIETYQTAEDEMGSGNVEAKQIYVDHLDYLYTTFEKANQDPMKWSKDQKEEILAVYDEGNKIEGIDNLQNWSKRSSEMVKIKDSLNASAKSDETKTEDTSKTSESDSSTDSTEEGE